MQLTARRPPQAAPLGDDLWAAGAAPEAGSWRLPGALRSGGGGPGDNELAAVAPAMFGGPAGWAPSPAADPGAELDDAALLAMLERPASDGGALLERGDAFAPPPPYAGGVRMGSAVFAQRPAPFFRDAGAGAPIDSGAFDAGAPLSLADIGNSATIDSIAWPSGPTVGLAAAAPPPAAGPAGRAPPAARGASGAESILEKAAKSHATNIFLRERMAKLRSRLELASARAQEAYQQRRTRQRHTAVIAGTTTCVLLLVFFCVCVSGRRGRRPKRQRDVFEVVVDERTLAGNGNDASHHHKHDGKALVTDMAHSARMQMKAIPHAWICCCCCRTCWCSWETMMHMWCFLVFYMLGAAALWHFGLIQPFLRQIVVYVFVLMGVLAVIMAMMYEIWLGMKKAIDEGRKTIVFVHDKIDNVLAMLGMPQDDEDLNSSSDDSDPGAPKKPRRPPPSATATAAAAARRQSQACC